MQGEEGPQGPPGEPGDKGDMVIFFTSIHPTINLSFYMLIYQTFAVVPVGRAWSTRASGSGRKEGTERK